MENKIKNHASSVVIIIFGVLIPAYFLIQAFIGIERLQNDFANDLKQSSPIDNIKNVKDELNETNDYYLFSLMYVENTANISMINKQQMKVIVMLIGFSVISIGMMFIILGIKEKNAGVDAKSEFNGITFDIKTGSTGITIFLIGSIMVVLGGVLKNSYKGSSLPNYHSSNIENEINKNNVFYHKLNNFSISCNKKNEKLKEKLLCVKILIEQEVK